METARWRLYMFPVFMCLIPSSFSVCGWGVFANLRKWYRFAFAVTFLDGLQSECFLLCPTTCFWFIHNVWSKLIPLVAAVAADKRRMMHCCSPGNVQFGQVAPCPWILNSPFVHGIRIWFFCGCKAVWSCQISFLKWENIQPGRRNGEVTPSESMQGLRLIWSDPCSSGQWQQPADFETAISLPACLGRGIRFFVLIFWSPGSLSSSLTSRREKKSLKMKGATRHWCTHALLCGVKESCRELKRLYSILLAFSMARSIVQATCLQLAWRWWNTWAID